MMRSTGYSGEDELYSRRGDRGVSVERTMEVPYARMVITARSVRAASEPPANISQLMQDAVARSRVDLRSAIRTELSDPEYTHSEIRGAHANSVYRPRAVVCQDHCAMNAEPLHQRRFVLGNRYLDAAALGGFDVLYDPSARTRRVLQRLREETESTEEMGQYARESSVDRLNLRARSVAVGGY